MKNIKLNVSKQRKFEGEIQLQSIGKKPAITAKNLMIGDVMVWNFGSTSKVVEVIPSKTGKTVTVITEYVNFKGEIENGKRRFNADRLVAIQDLNNPPEAEEVAEVKEAAAVEEVEIAEARAEVVEVEAVFTVNTDAEPVAGEVIAALSSDDVTIIGSKNDKTPYVLHIPTITDGEIPIGEFVRLDMLGRTKIADVKELLKYTFELIDASIDADRITSFIQIKGINPTYKTI